jgi:hypothetical protein
MPRDLLIVFGNDSNVVQTWAISNQQEQEVDPGDGAYFDIEVTGAFLLLCLFFFFFFFRRDDLFTNNAIKL